MKKLLRQHLQTGLWGDDRHDEDQIGASYPELEWAMNMKDEGKTIDDFEGRKQEVFAIFMRLNTINQHKMLPNTCLWDSKTP